MVNVDFYFEMKFKYKYFYINLLFIKYFIHAHLNEVQIM